MTRQEFINNQAAALKRAWIVAGLALALYPALLYGILWLYDWMVPLPEGRNSRNLVIAAVVAVPTLVLAILMSWINRRRQRRFGLLCPTCGKPLTEVLGPIAVATGHCGSCGGSVFELTEPNGRAEPQAARAGGGNH